MCKCKQLKQLEDENAGQARKIEALSQELNLALQTIEMMRRRMFGRSSEQSAAGQGMFDQFLAECDQLNGAAEPVEPETEKLEFERRKKGSNNLNGRLKIPDHLERSVRSL